MPGFAESGMLIVIPRPNAKKSLTLIRPITIAIAPSTACVIRDTPINRNTFSQAAMSAKYTSPLANTKVPPMSSTLRRSFRFTNNDRTNTSTHIAHGLKPSTNPSTAVNSGRPSLPASMSPKRRLATVDSHASDGVSPASSASMRSAVACPSQPTSKCRPTRNEGTPGLPTPLASLKARNRSSATRS